MEGRIERKTPTREGSVKEDRKIVYGFPILEVLNPSQMLELYEPPPPTLWQTTKAVIGVLVYVAIQAALFAVMWVCLLFSVRAILS